MHGFERRWREARDSETSGGNGLGLHLLTHGSRKHVKGNRDEGESTEFSVVLPVWGETPPSTGRRPNFWEGVALNSSHFVYGMIITGLDVAF